MRPYRLTPCWTRWRQRWHPRANSTPTGPTPTPVCVMHASFKPQPQAPASESTDFEAWLRSNPLPTVTSPGLFGEALPAVSDSWGSSSSSSSSRPDNHGVVDAASSAGGGGAGGGWAASSSMAARRRAAREAAGAAAAAEIAGAAAIEAAAVVSEAGAQQALAASPWQAPNMAQAQAATKATAQAQAQTPPVAQGQRKGSQQADEQTAAGTGGGCRAEERFDARDAVAMRNVLRLLCSQLPWWVVAVDGVLGSTVLGLRCACMLPW